MTFSDVIFNLLIILFLVFMNGFFVAAEFAIVKIRSSRLDMLIEAGDRRAKYAKILTDQIDAALSVTQLGITLASLGLGWVGEPAMAEMIRPLLSPFALSEATVHTIAFAVAFSLITACHIILGELAPKSMAIQNAEGVTLGVAIPLLIFHKLMYPFVWVLNSVANKVVHLLGFEPVDEGSEVHTGEEIRLLVEESHKKGYIDKTEFDFVDNVFDFAEKNVRDVMIPRTDMVCLYLDESYEENIAAALENQMTRYPICREGKDDIIGFLHIKDLMETVLNGRRPNLKKLARNVLMVPETMAISRLLKTMQQNCEQIAIVVDEYGGTAGMVTLEDVIEEIVGDIRDEFDVERPVVERIDELTYSVDAKLVLDELNDILELSLEDDDVESIGGWLLDRVEAPPRVGQKAQLESAEFSVEEIDRVRITRVLVKLASPLEDEHEEIALREKPKGEKNPSKKTETTSQDKNGGKKPQSINTHKEKGGK